MNIAVDFVYIVAVSIWADGFCRDGGAAGRINTYCDFADLIVGAYDSFYGKAGALDQGAGSGVSGDRQSAGRGDGSLFQLPLLVFASVQGIDHHVGAVGGLVIIDIQIIAKLILDIVVSASCTDEFPELGVGAVPSIKLYIDITALNAAGHIDGFPGVDVDDLVPAVGYMGHSKLLVVPSIVRTDFDIRPVSSAKTMDIQAFVIQTGTDQVGSIADICIRDRCGSRYRRIFDIGIAVGGGYEGKFISTADRVANWV